MSPGAVPSPGTVRNEIFFMCGNLEKLRIIPDQLLEGESDVCRESIIKDQLTGFGEVRLSRGMIFFSSRRKWVFSGIEKGF